MYNFYIFFFFSSRRRHTSFSRDWSSDVCSSDLLGPAHCFSGPPDSPVGGEIELVDSTDRSEGAAPASPWICGTDPVALLLWMTGRGSRAPDHRGGHRRPPITSP